MARRLQNNPLDTILQTRQEPQQPQQPQQQPEPQQVTEAPAFDADRERAALGITPADDGKRGRGKPRNNELVRGGVQDGLTEEWTRASFIMRISTLQKLKDYAYTNRIRYKDALDQILTDFLATQDDLLPHQ